MQLSRQRRDFGLTAILITLFVGTLAAGVTVAAALAQDSLTVAAFNNLSRSTAQAFETQQHINLLTHRALLNLQQQIDLIGHDVDTLWQVATVSCTKR